MFGETRVYILRKHDPKMNQTLLNIQTLHMVAPFVVMLQNPKHVPQGNTIEV